MRKTRAVIAAFGCSAVAGACALFVPGALEVPSATASSTPIYQDTTYNFGERAADMVARMTTAQKASEVVNGASAIPSLGIQAYNWWTEANHGVFSQSVETALDNLTSYPTDQSAGSTWDRNLQYQIGVQIAAEMRETRPNNNLNLSAYAPTIQLGRDPRWGRVDESWSEDPYLTAQLASQSVDGRQGEDQNGNPTVPAADGLPGDYYLASSATIKHYASNNSEVDRMTGSANYDERTLHEYDGEDFGGVMELSHPNSVMSSYNEINGTPDPDNLVLNESLMRYTFGFTGFFTGDCDAVTTATSGHHWQPPGYSHVLNAFEDVGWSTASGEDEECGSVNMTNGPEAVGDAIVTQADTYNVNDLDTSVTRMMKTRMELGEFDNPANVPWVTQADARVPQNSWVSSNANNAETETPARLALARQAGDEAIVLLKNNGSILPLKVPASGPYKVAVVGKEANITNFYLGGYSDAQTAAGQAKEVTPLQGITAAIQGIDPSAQVDYYSGFTGTSTSASGLTTVDTTGGVGATNLPDANSINNLTANGPYNVVIVDVGTDSTSGREGQDRPNISLPGAQAALIQDVYAINPNEVVYMQTDSTEDVTGFDDPTPYDPTDTQVAANPPGVLWSSYQSEEEGAALGDVLTGSYNPSGRLSTTWYHDVSDLPNISDYDIRPNGPDSPVGATNLPSAENGRTYMYYSGPISYPFGYGLSYTTFSYSNLQIDNTTPTADNTIHVSVNVTNNGTTAAQDGNDVVEMYVNQPNAPAALQRPIKRLEGFKFVFIPHGQTTTVTFTLPISQLEFWDGPNSKWAVDDGLYGIQISSSAADQDIQQEGFINVSGSLTPVLSTVFAQPSMPGDAARGIQQRVMFPIGATISPNLTVSMNDSTIYGRDNVQELAAGGYNALPLGTTVSFPAGMAFSYSSDHPGTVSVAPNGTITTLANGAATITATATYQGVSKSASFAVRVLSELSGITVNGQPLAGFHSDAYDYDMVLANGVGTPTVAATDPDSGATVSIAQAPGVPGSATITDTGPDGIVLTYVINFAYGAVGDNFNSATLGSQWSITRPDPNDWSLTQNPGSLTITPETGDLNAATNTAKNLFLQPELGDWTITSKLTFNVIPHTATQQGGIIAYQDDDDYLKLDWEAASATTAELAVTTEDDLSGTPRATVLATVATSTIPALASGANKTVWLRIAKSGAQYSEYYSTDGVTWVLLYQFGESLTNVKVGMFSYNRAGTGTDLNVAFDYFHTTNAATTASFSPAASNGFFKGNETVTLSPTDPTGPGILSTSYSVDGGPIQTYTGPFQITGEGAHTLTYYSTDNANNVEGANTQAVDIDETKPITTARINGITVPANATSFTATAPATVSLSAVDPPAGTPPVASGVNQTWYSINGGAPILYSGPFVLDPQNGNTDTGGAITFKYWSTDNAGNIEDPTITLVLEPTVGTTVSSNVPSTLAISVGATAPSFGTFVPGLASTYTASVGATITTTAASSALTASDTCSPAATCFPGDLVNSTATGGPYRLASGLQVDATSANVNASGGSIYTDLSVTNPAPLLSYSMPVSNDPVTIGFKQNIGATDPLRTGPYTKTITITLSTNTP